MDLQDTRQTLLRRAQSGEDQAWRRLTDLYRPFIADWAMRHTDVRADVAHPPA